MSRRKIKFVTGVVIVASAILVLVAISIQGNMAYYIEVSDFLDRSGSYTGNFRVRGNVVPGTIERTPGALGAVFRMSDGVGEMKVKYGRELPDTFVDEAEVVVEGEMTPAGVFEAHTLLAKCPSKYEAEVPEGAPMEHPEEIPVGTASS